MVIKTKKYKFAINVDEYGRRKETLSELLDLLTEEYPFLKQANRMVTKKRALNAKVGEVIIFGFSKKYDYRVVTEEEYDELSIHRNTPLVNLVEDWEEVEELLQQYAVANYPNDFDSDDDYYCCAKKKVYYIEDVCFDDIYVVQQPKKKSTTTRRKTYTKKSNLKLDDVSVHHTHVKVGWDVFDILLDRNDEEFIKVDGNIYWIDRDSNGNGKLSVQ